MMSRDCFVSFSHSATSLCLLFKRKSVSRLSIYMLTKSNRFHFANKSSFEAQSWSMSSFSYCFLIDFVSSKLVIDLFTRFQFLHNFELNRIIFETTSKEFRFSKAVRISLLFKHQFRHWSYFWLSKQSQLWISLIRWARFNECSFIFECEFCSFIVFEYQSLLSRSFSIHACEWRNFSRRSLRIESVSYFHRYSVFDDDLNRCFFLSLLTLLLLRIEAGS